MSIAEARRSKATRAAKFYQNLAVGNGFVLLGNLSSYPSLAWGSFVLLALCLLAVEFPAIVATLTAIGRDPYAPKAQVNQKLALLGASFFLPLILFALGRLI